MVKKIGMIVLGLILTFALVFGGWGCAKPAPAPAPEVIKWKVQGALPLKTYTTDLFYVAWCEKVTEKSQGRLELTYYLPNALCPVMDTMDNVSKGAIEAAGGSGAYNKGVLPEADVEFGMPCALTDVDQVYEFYYEYKGGAVMDLLKKLYAERGIHYIALVPFRNAFMTKFPINKAEDLKGKKVRSVGSYADLVKNLGGSSVTIPSAENYMALQRGTVDGTAMAIYAAETNKLKEVISYISLPACGVSTMCIYCSADAYNKLPDDLKKLVDDVGKECAYDVFWPAYKELEAADLKKVEDYGVEFITLSDTEFEKVREAAYPIWEANAAKSAASATIIDLLKSYLKEKGLMK